MLDRPDLVADPRFASNNARVANRAALTTTLDALFGARAAGRWLAALEEADVPAGPINDLAEVFANPQVASRAMGPQVAHPLAPALRLVGNPIKLSATQGADPAPPPMLGEHTDAILTNELGCSAEDVAGLRARRVI